MFIKLLISQLLSLIEMKNNINYFLFIKIFYKIILINSNSKRIILIYLVIRLIFQQKCKHNMMNLKVHFFNAFDIIKIQLIMKKSKRVDIQKFESELLTESDPEKIKTKISLVHKKNQKYQEEIAELIRQLQQSRQKNIKLSKQINESVKDRMQQIEKITLDSTYTRDPEQRKQGMKNVTERYQFMQMQNQKFLNNFENIDKNLNYYISRLNKLQNQLSSMKIVNKNELENLEKQFQKYKKLQQEENQKNKILQQDFDQRQKYYQLVDKQISQYRGKYAIVEANANKLEKQLQERINQFQTRQRNDKLKYENAQQRVRQLQYEMINLKKIINNTQDQNIDLQIKDHQVQYTSTKESSLKS